MDQRDEYTGERATAPATEQPTGQLDSINARVAYLEAVVKWALSELGKWGMVPPADLGKPDAE